MITVFALMHTASAHWSGDQQEYQQAEFSNAKAQLVETVRYKAQKGHNDDVQTLVGILIDDMGQSIGGAGGHSSPTFTAVQSDNAFQKAIQSVQQKLQTVLKPVPGSQNIFDKLIAVFNPFNRALASANIGNGFQAVQQLHAAQAFQKPANQLLDAAFTDALKLVAVLPPGDAKAVQKPVQLLTDHDFTEAIQDVINFFNGVNKGGDIVDKLIAVLKGRRTLNAIPDNFMAIKPTL